MDPAFRRASVYFDDIEYQRRFEQNLIRYGIPNSVQITKEITGAVAGGGGGGGWCYWTLEGSNIVRYGGNVGVGVHPHSNDFEVRGNVLVEAIAEQPYVEIRNWSDTEYDPVIHWSVGATPVKKFTMGVDDSDSDCWLLCSGGYLSKTPASEIFDLTRSYGTSLVVVEVGPNRIQKLLRSDLSYVAKIGSSGAGDDQFSSAQGICSDGTFLYICDTANDRIQKRRVDDLSFVAKSSGVAGTLYSYPKYCCTDGTYLYFGGYASAEYRVYKILCSDLSYVDHISATDDLNNAAMHMATDGTYLYLEAKGGNTYRMFKVACATMTRVLRVQPTGEDGYNDGFLMMSAFLKDGVFYLLGSYSTTTRIFKYDAATLVFISYSSNLQGTGDGQLTSACGMDTDGTYVYTTEAAGVAGINRVQKLLLSDYSFVAKIGVYGNGNGEFWSPFSIVCVGSFSTATYTPANYPILAAALDGSYVDSYPVHRFRDQIQLMEDGVVAATKYIGLNAPGAITASYNITLPAAVPGAQAHFAISTAGVVTFGQNVGTTGSPTFVRITSLSVAIGTAPITVTSTTVCTNLNAEMVDGVHIATLSVGAIPYASSASNLAALAAVAAGSYLRSDGLTTAPLWSTLKLPNAATAYRLPVATSANTIGEVAAVGATGEYLAGATGAIPAWATLNQAAVAGLTTADSPTFAGLTLTADLTVPNGGTGASTFALNGVLFGNGAGAIGVTAIGTEGQFLRVGANPFVPAWSTLTLPNTGTAYRLPVFSAANVMTELAAVGATGEYLKGNSGAIPSWATLNQAAIAGLTTGSSPSFVALSLTIADGTTPMTVTSKTAVANLNADLLDGYHAISFAASSHSLLSVTHGDTDADVVEEGDIIYGISPLPGWPRAIRFALPIPTADLVDFPAKVPIVAGTPESIAIGAACRADGFDIRFTAIDGVTELPYERESFSVAGGEASGIFWVKTGVATAGTYVWCYYGNASATDGATPEDVWDANFAAVYHMNDAEDTSHIHDSTANANTGTKTGAGTPAEVAGKIAQAQEFIKPSLWAGVAIDCGITDSLRMQAELTVEAWISADDVGANFAGIASRNYDVWTYGLYGSGWGAPGLFQLTIGGVEYRVTIPAFVFSAWAHVAVVFKDADDTIDWYFNGAFFSQTTGAVGTIPVSNNHLFLGKQVAGPYFYDGLMDEPRISSIARSAAWIAYEYANMNPADGGLTWGAEEPTARWTRLAKGAAGTYLAGGATTPSWATLNQAAVAGLTTSDSPSFAGFTKIGGASDYLSVAADGELTLAGTARVLNTVWIDAGGIKAPGVKPATAIAHGTLETPAWQFSAEEVAGNQETISFNFRIPNGMDRTAAPTISFGWSSTTTAGNVVWQLAYLWRSADEDTSAAAQETIPITVAVSGTAEGMVYSTFTGIDVPSATDICLHCQLTRLSADVADNVADDVELHGLCLQWTSDKLGTAT